jgi:RND family efflux transporter MFP subunit
MNKRWARRGIWVVGLALLFGCHKANQLVAPPPPKVTAAKPLERPVADTVEFVGTAEPTITVDLRARVGGYLRQILFKDGENVKLGQPLFVIDQAPYQVALEGALAAEEKAVASLALAESQKRRMTPLVGTAVTQEEYDVQSAQVETAKADVAGARAAVKKARQDLGYTEIKAPVAGRIGRHMVDVGNLVQAQETPLANIQALDPIYAIFDVSESDFNKYLAMRRKNELPDPEKNPPTLHLAIADEEGFPHEGKLDYRDLVFDSQTGTTRRRAIFPNPDWQIIPGMDVRIQAQVGDPQPKLLVDERAIGTDQRGDYLLVVNDKNVVEYRMVKLGSKVGGMRAIEHGVNKNDWVIVNGLQRARPGATVNPEKTTMTDQLAEQRAADAKTAAASEKQPSKMAAAPAPPKTTSVNASPAAKKSSSEKKQDAAAKAVSADAAPGLEEKHEIAPKGSSNPAGGKSDAESRDASSAGPAEAKGDAAAAATPASASENKASK